MKLIKFDNHDVDEKENHSFFTFSKDTVLEYGYFHLFDSNSEMLSGQIGQWNFVNLNRKPLAAVTVVSSRLLRSDCILFFRTTKLKLLPF